MTMTEGLLRQGNPLLVEHILLCPGCKDWQMHYTWMGFSDLIQWSVPLIASEPLDFDLSEAQEAIEGLLGDHVASECTHPRRVMEQWRAAKKKW